MCLLVQCFNCRQIGRYIRKTDGDFSFWHKKRTVTECRASGSNSFQIQTVQFLNEPISRLSGVKPLTVQRRRQEIGFWFSRIIRIQRCVRGSGHEPMASPDCPLRHCVAGSGHKPNAKTSAYDEGNDSVIATADAPTRTQSIRDVSAIGNKCIRRRLRFVRSYCHEHYTYSC